MSSENALWVVYVCPSVQSIQLKNRWMDLDEIWHEACAILQDYRKVIFNIIRPVVTKWRSSSDLVAKEVTIEEGELNASTRKFQWTHEDNITMDLEEPECDRICLTYDGVRGHLMDHRNPEKNGNSWATMTFT